jgi:GWxTD domain-containing protein
MLIARYVPFAHPFHQLWFHMRYYIIQLRLFLFTCLLLASRAQSIFALDAGYSYAVYANGEKPYVEINLEIASSSIFFVKTDSTHVQGAVEVLIIFKQGERVANYETFQLNSPILTSPMHLLDVKRFAIENGDYEVELVFIDVNKRTNKSEIIFPLKVEIQPKPYLSELQLLRSFKPDESAHPFTKNGYYLEPLPFRYYNKSAERIAFYAEMYNTDLFAKEPYLVRYFVEELAGNGYTRLAAVGSQRKKPSSIDAMLGQMAINELPSGSYRLTLELRDNQNAVICTRSLEFQRSNPPAEPFIAGKITDEDLSKQFVEKLTEEELVYALRAIRPVTPQTQTEALQNVLAHGDPKQMRYFLFNHFVNLNNLQPEAIYTRYMEVARAVDKLYNSGFGYGFETDRGLIFMKYGKPDDMVKVTDDPSAPPYEIWLYYNYPATKQTNVKFLFYNQTLSPGDFALLHSNARNERNNPRWEVDLYGKLPNEMDTSNGSNYHDATQMVRNTGRNARALFNDL